MSAHHIIAILAGMWGLADQLSASDSS